MDDTAKSSSQSPVLEKENAVPSTPAKKAPKRVNKIIGLKKPSTKSSHPPTSELVLNAIKTLQDRNGSSLQAIKKFIASNYKLDTSKLAPFIKKYLKNAVVAGKLIQTKGKGASGSFKLPAIAATTKDINEKKKKDAKAPKAIKDKKIKKSDGKKEKKKKEKSPETAIKTLSEKKKHSSLKKGKKKSSASIKSTSAAPKQKSTKPSKVASKVKAPKTKKAPSVKKAASIGGTEKKAHKNAKTN